MKAENNRRSISAAARVARGRQIRRVTIARGQLPSSLRLSALSLRLRRPALTPEAYATQFAELQDFIGSLPDHRAEVGLPPMTDDELYEASRQ